MVLGLTHKQGQAKTGPTPDGLGSSLRVRRTPYTDRVIAAGARRFTVVNHMLLARDFLQSREEQYRHLNERVQIWDVSCQRQVEVRGPDAGILIQTLTPRNISGARPGHCLYIPVVDDKGFMVNDPILLVHGKDHFWLSVSDSDLELFAKGLAIGSGLNVSIREASIWPLAVQGPLAESLMVRVCGADVSTLGFFRHRKFPVGDGAEVVSRTGYSRQDGFEIYVSRPDQGEAIWDRLVTAGRDLGVKAGGPNLPDRIEAGLLSYGNDMNRDTTPFELGLEHFCTLDGSIEFAGLRALRTMAGDFCSSANSGRPVQRIGGIRFGGPPCPPCSTPWSVLLSGVEIGLVTSAAWSPGLNQNIALAMLLRQHLEPGQAVEVETPGGDRIPGEVAQLPFRPRGRPAKVAGG
ncbi:MAG: dimethylsulfoniopropionate demethylase [Paracoccaceae bacterium]|nr:dimethylsulfoniopropionate demethylase [Paracoccaceae bacterium]